jgi:hypothetical protein
VNSHLIQWVVTTHQPQLLGSWLPTTNEVLTTRRLAPPHANRNRIKNLATSNASGLMLVHGLRYLGIMRADPWLMFAVKESVASQRHLAQRLLPEATDDVLSRVLRRVENRLATRLSRGVSTASLESDAVALIMRARRSEARLHSGDLVRNGVAPGSPEEFLAHVASRLTYLETLTDLWLRAGFTMQEIATDQCSSVRAIRRLRNRALSKLRRATDPPSR